MCTKNNSSVVLKSTGMEQDLGIKITSDLKWHQHVKYAANKANKILGMLRRTFSNISPELMKVLYTSFVRPHLEYGVAVCNPYARSDVEQLEKVQRRATRLIPSYRGLSYAQRLNKLGLTSLEQRRIRGDLIQTYKILHNLDAVSWCSTQTMRIKQSDIIRTRGHSMKLTREIVKNCEQRHNFFPNRVTSHWNALPDYVVSAPTLNSYKARLDKHMESYPQAYSTN